MPRIGLLSDSHGRPDPTRRAIELLLAHDVQLLLHLGDVGSTEVIDALAAADPTTGKQIEAHLVFGNTDWDTTALTRYAQDIGVTVDHPSGHLAFDGVELIFCHGHERQPMKQAIAKGTRYLCHGHTHQASDTHEGRTRIINPGALHRARQYSVALLETESDTLTFYPVPSG